MKADLAIPGNKPIILGYHDINNRFDWSINSVHLSDFKNHLEFISTINPSDVRLLFDDGFKGLISLLAYIADKSQVMVSIITGSLNGNNNWDTRPGGGKALHLSESDVKLLAQEGVSILSHGHSHLALDCLSPKRVKMELIISKEKLEQITSQRINGISFPFGRFDNRVLDIAKEVGYEKFYSNRQSLDQPHVHRVFTVYRWDGIGSLKRKMESQFFEEKRLNFINYFSLGTVLIQKFKGLYSNHFVEKEEK